MSNKNLDDIVTSFNLQDCISKSSRWENIYYWLYRNTWMKITDLIQNLKFAYQRVTRGFDDSELWSLDWTIARFILPRLKAFRAKNVHGVPIRYDAVIEEGNFSPPTYTEEEWKAILDKMIRAFELSAHQWDSEYLKKNNLPDLYSKEYSDQLDEGLKLFYQHFGNLWD